MFHESQYPSQINQIHVHCNPAILYSGVQDYLLTYLLKATGFNLPTVLKPGKSGKGRKYKHKYGHKAPVRSDGSCQKMDRY